LITIRHLLGPAKENDEDFIRALLATLQQSLIVLPEQSHFLFRLPVSVPAAASATAALNLFHAFYGKRKHSVATLVDACHPNASVLIVPLSQTYKDESMASQEQRATGDLTLLLLDLLMQRADAGEDSMTLAISER